MAFLIRAQRRDVTECAEIPSRRWAWDILIMSKDEDRGCTAY